MKCQCIKCRNVCDSGIHEHFGYYNNVFAGGVTIYATLEPTAFRR
jgi:hypothetical protein